MIQNFFHITYFISAIVYTLICLASLLVASSYWRAYCKEKPSRIIRSLVFLFLSIAFAYTFFLLASLIAIVEGGGLKYKLAVSLLAITNLPLLFGIINFWNVSITEG